MERLLNNEMHVNLGVHKDGFQKSDKIGGGCFSYTDKQCRFLKKEYLLFNNKRKFLIFHPSFSTIFIFHLCLSRQSSSSIFAF